MAMPRRLAIGGRTLYIVAVPTRSRERSGAGMPSRSKASPETIAEQEHLPVKEIQMPKLKTKSSAKKRFSLTGSGKVRANFAGKRHNLRKRSKKMKRKARGTQILCAADARIVKSCLPNA
jgi:large subunit ribosomal protein L35